MIETTGITRILKKGQLHSEHWEEILTDETQHEDLNCNKQIVTTFIQTNLYRISPFSTTDTSRFNTQNND